MNLSASIVLFHNKKNDVISVIDCAIKSRIEIIIVIDQSANDYYRFLSNYSTKILYIKNINNGYGAGHNLAIKILKCDYNPVFHIVLNPDITFSIKAIDGLWNYISSNSNVGLIMPKIYYPDGNLQYLCKLLPTPIDIIIRLLFHGQYFKKRYNRFILRDTGYNKIMNIPCLSGCFMFFKLSVFIEVGGFDERFFMYFEDFDLSRRIHKKYETIYYPFEEIEHAHAASHRNDRKMLFISLKSTIKYFNKWGWLIDREREYINRNVLRRYIHINNTFK